VKLTRLRHATLILDFASTRVLVGPMLFRARRLLPFAVLRHPPR
jgi:L-ascorbate metabolism protein UlaG (beta-lactamase superfamily)